MTSQFEYSPVSNSEEIQQLGIILSQCFGDSLSDWQAYFHCLGTQNFRLIRQAGRIIGGLGIYHMGQWYGGRQVPVAGIAALGIVPEARQRGAAYQLMSCTLRELHQQGVPISVLYAATQRLYRQVGYEQGGSFCFWQLATESIQLQEPQLQLHRVNPLEWKVFEQLYRQQAQKNNGNLERNSAVWEQVVKPSSEETVYAYLVGAKNQPQGYVIFTQKQTTQGLLLTIQDWALLTAAAIRRFWTFLAAHCSQIKLVRWKSSLQEPNLLLLPEQSAVISHSESWLLRVIDVSRALEARGYPTGIEAELHLEVKDDLLASNNGKFCLRVSQGRGEVIKGGKGEFQMGIRGLACLYTGLFTPYQLQLTGYLKTTKEALLTATLLFSGSPPWMPDIF